MAVVPTKTIDDVIDDAVAALVADASFSAWLVTTFGVEALVIVGSDSINPPGEGVAPWIIFERDTQDGGPSAENDEYALMVAFGSATSEESDDQLVEDKTNMRNLVTSIGLRDNAQLGYRLSNAIIASLQGGNAQVEVQIVFDSSALSPLYVGMLAYTIRVQRTLGCSGVLFSVTP